MKLPLIKLKLRNWPKYLRVGKLLFVLHESSVYSHRVFTFYGYTTVIRWTWERGRVVVSRYNWL